MPVSPALAFTLTNGGNYASCLALPRDQTLQIFCTPAYQKSGAVNPEAEVAWRFMGATGLTACAAAMIADKAASGDAKRNLNIAVAGTSLVHAGLFATNTTMKEDVRPAIRALNIATNLAVAGLAIKEAVGK